MVGSDGYEDGLGSGEDLAGGVGETGFAAVRAAASVDVAGDKGERAAEGDGTEVMDFELAGHGEDAAGTVGFAHGFVKEGGDDASVGVAGGSGKAAGEAEVADDVVVGVCEEFEAEAGGVGGAAAEAVVEGAVSEGGEGGIGHEKTGYRVWRPESSPNRRGAPGADATDAREIMSDAAEQGARRASEEEGHEGGGAAGVGDVGIAELGAHPFLFEAEFEPERKEDEGEGE